MECSVLAAARELFDARQFPGVVAVCSEALVERPRDVDLRLLRARALLALRREPAAQTEVGEILRIDPRCGAAYRLLGELAARRDEVQSARAFLRDALRLSPGDEETIVWLEIVDAMVRPTAPADQIPAAAGAVGHLSPLAPLRPRLPHVRLTPRAIAAPTPPPVARPTPARAAGTPPPVSVRAAGTPPPVRAPATPPPLPPSRTRPPLPRRAATARGTVPPPADSLPPVQPTSFGGYLVDVGVLSELQLRAALAYKKSTGVRLGAAAVALGFATEARIESASLVYHGRHRRPSTIDVIATARPSRRDSVLV